MSEVFLSSYQCDLSSICSFTNMCHGLLQMLTKIKVKFNSLST